MHIVSASKTFFKFNKFQKFQNPEFPSPVHTGSLCSHVVQVTALSDFVKPFLANTFFLPFIQNWANSCVCTFGGLSFQAIFPDISVTSLVPFAKLITCSKLFTFTFLHTSLFKQFFLLFFSVKISLSLLLFNPFLCKPLFLLSVTSLSSPLQNFSSLFANFPFLLPDLLP